MRRKRLIVLNIIILVTIVTNLIIVFSNGQSMSARSHKHFADNVEIKETHVKYSKKGVVKVTGLEIDPKNNELLINVKSVGDGETNLRIRTTIVYPNGNTVKERIKKHFETSLFGIVLDTTQMADYNNYKVTVFSFFFILLVTIIFLMWEYITDNKRGEFSYAMIACGAIAFFSFVILSFGLYKYLNHSVDTFGSFINIITETGQLILVLLTPFMFAMSVFLTISNIWLIKHEGKRLVNTLGIAFGLLWALGTFAVLGPFFSVFKPLPIPSIARYILIYVMSYIECMFIVTGFSAVLSVRYVPDLDRDYIIILGCGIRKDGTLTPLLRGRVNAALNFGKKQFEKTGKPVIYVPSGGQGTDEVIPEAEAMKNYLLEKGVPEDHILPECKSTSTLENMKFSREIIENDSGNIKKKKIAFATTNYHIFRGYVISRKLDFVAKGISAGTKKYFYANAFLREFIGLIVDQMPRHIMYMTILCLFFLSMWLPSW